MDKKAASLLPGQAWKNIGAWFQAHPKAVTGTKVVGGAGLGYLGGKSLADLIASWRTGQATYGNPADLYAKGSYLNTVNPISSVTGGIDKVPEWYIKMFPNTDQGRLNAHGTFKAGAVGLLAAALVGGYRAVKHYGEMEDLENADRPAKDLAGQLSTTFEGNMAASQDKEASGRVPGPGVFTYRNFLGTAIPLGASLLAASLAYKATDNYFDARRNKALDKAIASKEEAIKQLIATRARMAKGVGTPDELSAATEDLGDKDIYVKDAALQKKALIGMNDLFQHAGAMTSAIILASALGTYAYTSARDENNLAYKAYKKALKEYAKNKSGITPVTIAPTDAKSYFDYINGGAQPAATPREQPAFNTDDLNKPISVTI